MVFVEVYRKLRLKEAVRFWGLYTILIGGGEGERALMEKTNDF